MKKNHDVLIQEFVIKRAFRIGRVSRQNLIRAFDLTTATSTRALAEALSVYPSLLERRGKIVYPKPGAKIPQIADESSLLSELDSGRNDPQMTGIFEEEVPITYVRWTQSLPHKQGVLMMIIEAIRTDSLLEIVYVGLKRNALPTSRLIIPLALERMNDQWRVVAQDIRRKGEKKEGKTVEPEPQVRNFVLSRILDAKWYRGRKSKGVLRMGHWDRLRKVPVIINPLYNDHQKEVIERELKIENGVVEIPSRSFFEFSRRFMDTPTSHDVVWPPLIKKEP